MMMPEKQTMTLAAAKDYIEDAALEAENANYHDLCRVLYDMLKVLDTVKLPVTILSVVDLEYFDSGNIAYIEVVDA